MRDRVWSGRAAAACAVVLLAGCTSSGCTSSGDSEGGAAEDPTSVTSSPSAGPSLIAGVAQIRCEASWLAFAGGSFVADPGCVPLIVRSGTQEAQVRLGIGVPCPDGSP